MKKTVIIVIFLSCYKLFAQTIVPVEQMGNYNLASLTNKTYFKDVNNVMEKYLGSWFFDNGIKRVEINIYKFEDTNYRGSDFIKDEFYIEFKYTENGTVQFDTMGQDQKYFIAGGGFWWPEYPDKYRLLYNEPGQNWSDNYQYLIIEYLPDASGGVPHLSWNVHVEPLREYPTLPQMPLNMTFTKQ